MKANLIGLFLLPAMVSADSLPLGVTLTFSLKHGDHNAVQISRKDPVVILLKYSNHTNHVTQIRIHDYDPHHKKLPYPVGCAVRITDSKGRLHPHAESNGEWWSQFICWSTLFDNDDERNDRKLKPKEELVYEVPLAAVLKVPAGGEPEGWPYNHVTGFRTGDYRFQFRYDKVTSQTFSLRVVDSTAKPKTFGQSR